jgi:hypothetical protein
MHSERDSRGGRYAPKVHGVHEGLGAVGRPVALVGKVGHVPHQLVHDLGKLDGVGRGTSTATASSRTLAVRNVALVVGRVEILAVPAATSVLVRGGASILG